MIRLAEETIKHALMRNQIKVPYSNEFIFFIFSPPLMYL